MALIVIASSTIFMSSIISTIGEYHEYISVSSPVELSMLLRDRRDVRAIVVTGSFSRWQEQNTRTICNMLQPFKGMTIALSDNAMFREEISSMEPAYIIRDDKQALVIAVENVLTAKKAVPSVH